MKAIQAILLQPDFLACLESCITTPGFLAEFDRLTGRQLATVNPYTVVPENVAEINAAIDALIWYIDETVYRHRPRPVLDATAQMIQARVLAHLV